MRDSFSIYRSVFEALKAYPPEEAMKAFVMIGEYSMDDKSPEETSGYAYGLFTSVKPLLDRSKKRSEAGRIGGQTEKQNEANVKQNEANGSNLEAKKKEERRKEKGEREKSSILSDEQPAEYPYKEVVDRLNAKAGTAFKDKSKDTRSHIKARFDEGYSLDDFFTVIDKKVADWQGTEQEKYLRPSTLFGTKFESYLNQKVTRKQVSRLDVVDDWLMGGGT